MGKLDRNNSVGFQQLFHPRDKTIEIRNLSQHVIHHQQVRLLTYRDQFAGDLLAKENYQGRNTFLKCNVSNIYRRLDSQN